MLRVLIVDDEPLLLEELQEALELEGFEVTAAASVPEALSHAARAGFDAVVTDLRMPKAGGLELISQLGRDRFAGLKIVVSGHGAEAARAEAMAFGADACFSKPLDTDALAAFIRSRL